MPSLEEMLSPLKTGRRCPLKLRTKSGSVSVRVSGVRTWRNQIILERDPRQHQDVDVNWTPPGQNTPARRRFFQIIVRNRHRHTAATDCYVYLEKATNLATSEHKSFPAFELKWEGYRFPYVNIPPAQQRRFDAFSIFHHSPTRLRFSEMFSDWNEIVPLLEGAGRYDLNYWCCRAIFPLLADRSF